MRIRTLTTEDGKNIYNLVKQSSVLDNNSEYAYLLMGAHFHDTCAVAESDNTIVGFVSSYIIPNQPDTLFVWQVATSPNHQKQGIAKKLLAYIANKHIQNGGKYIHATIDPTNKASRKLFASLASTLDTSWHEQTLFTEDHFSESHQSEPLIVIGPVIQPKKEAIYA